MSGIFSNVIQTTGNYVGHEIKSVKHREASIWKAGGCKRVFSMSRFFFIVHWMLTMVPTYHRWFNIIKTIRYPLISNQISFCSLIQDKCNDRHRYMVGHCGHVWPFPCMINISNILRSLPSNQVVFSSLCSVLPIKGVTWSIPNSTQSYMVLHVHVYLEN